MMAKQELEQLTKPLLTDDGNNNYIVEIKYVVTHGLSHGADEHAAERGRSKSTNFYLHLV
jgi:hypothetical protein